jgi:hypothetical protein
MWWRRTLVLCPGEFEWGDAHSGQHGGLSESLHALRMLALTHGVPVDQVVPEVMAMLTGTGVSQQVVPRTPPAPPAPRVRRVHRHPASIASGAQRPVAAASAETSATVEEFVEPQVLKEQADPGLVFIRRMLVAAGVVVLVLVVGAVGLYFMTAGSNRYGWCRRCPNGTALRTLAHRRSTCSASITQITPKNQRRWSKCRSTLSKACARWAELDAAPEAAMKKFRRAACRWPTASSAQRRHIDAAMEFVKCHRWCDRAQRAIGTFVSGDLRTLRPSDCSDVTHACFCCRNAAAAAGRDLPSSMLGDLHGVADRHSATRRAGRSFGGGVTATVGRLPGLLLGEGVQGRVMSRPRGRRTPSASWRASAAIPRCGSRCCSSPERVVLTDRDPHQTRRSWPRCAHHAVIGRRQSCGNGWSSAHAAT